MKGPKHILKIALTFFSFLRVNYPYDYRENDKFSRIPGSYSSYG